MSKKMATLHNHSYRSLLDSTMSPEEVVQQAYDFGYTAVALTEHGNMFSFIDGYKKAKELGIKFIAGCEVYETSDMDYKEKDADRFHLLLLAKSDVGLKNLFRIVSEGSTRGFYGKPRVDLELMKQYSEDVICMTACLGSRIDRFLYNGRCSCCHEKTTHEECGNFEPKFDEAIEWVNKYKEVFGDNFYIELQSHDTEASAIANPRLLQLAEITNTKYTITFDTHMKDGSELYRDIHRTFLMIGQDREDKDNQIYDTYNGCWQQDIDTIHSIMDKQIGREAVELGMQFTVEVAEGCDIDIKLHQDLMPKVKIPKEFKSDKDYLRHLALEGFVTRGLHKWSIEDRQPYLDRLEYELEVLDYLDYNSYFILNAMITKKAKEREIPLGYSRGSGANCLTFWLIGVTEIDSIEWDLDFSRFANKGRKGSAADYDLDISQLRRNEVFEILKEILEEDDDVPVTETRIAQTATFNSLSPKVAIKDIGKVMDEQGLYSLPYKVREKISKLVPDDANKKMTIERALESSAPLRKYAEQYPLLFEYVKHLQNIPKSVGCHASAVMVTPTSINDFCPIMYNQNGNVMIQLEMGNAMEDIGMVKLDFLGLVTLDVVDKTLELAGLTWDDINLQTLNLNDQDVFREIFAKGNTLGIFQMETHTPTDMFRRLQTNNIHEVIAVNALNRPAVLSVGMENVYIKNKHNPNNAEYIHEDLRSIFEVTNGIMLFQEQALKCFGLAGFPEDETDTARRAIGKKKEDVMKSLFEDFQSGLSQIRWTVEQIQELWVLIESQSTYSFNKGHSTAYGLLAYVTAYLKHHYPVEFMTALLISETGDYSQTTKYIDECRRMEIKVLPPNINKSKRSYTISNSKILFGLESIKGVGAKAADVIFEELDKVGKFKSVTDFIERTPVDRTTILSLIKSGAFGKRKDDYLRKYGESLFGDREYKEVKTVPARAKLEEMGLTMSDSDWKDKVKRVEIYNNFKRKKFQEERKEKLEKHMQEFVEKYMGSSEMYEFETLSIFLNGTPFDDVKHFFKPFESYEDDSKAVLCGTITDIKNKKQKNGKKFAYINLLTLEGVFEGVIFADKYEEYQDIIKKGNNIVILCIKNGEQFRIESIKTFAQWKEEKIQKGELKE